jgi:signal transduction histidine kinase
VPIHSKGEWIGLLGLGPKVSGDRYDDHDLDLLSTLADQTAVALENARLVADLFRLNIDLKQAYVDLEKASHQLQEMDKLKSAFIGVITHELRTPVANIAFSLQVLERYGRQNLIPGQEEQMDQLAADVEAAKTTIDGLVTFASFLRKQGELKPEWIDFNEIVQGALLPLRPLAENKGLVLEVNLPDRSLDLFGDSERLADAAHHLIHNAIKFTSAGGQIRVSSREEGDRLYFEVADTGAGVPAEKLDDLWEGFSQMADPLRRGVEGLGLGLALVKYVAHAHEGEVCATSQEGAGSTFGFWLPLQP